MKNATLKLVAIIIFATFTFTAQAASVPKAEMLLEHGLNTDAKRELIDVLFSRAGASKKSEAMYMLGSIAFEERRISVALNVWRELVAEYPTSNKAALVKGKIAELAEIVGESTDKAINNAVAQSYLNHADFWSEDKDNIFRIDSSWIANVEAAVKWYDKVIAEFPESVAAEQAFTGKLRALFGWKRSGEYDLPYGLRKNFYIYMPQILATFEQFEAQFPKAGALQAFRYQIAQAYWGNKDWNETREWLNKIIKEAGDKDSFYRDLAERRLHWVEY